MSFNLSEFNWPLIIIIALISATVSYVGDILGKKIGKKRISLLRLRPRYTSTLITILTGVGVALMTLVAAVYASDSVKMAIFGPNIMARQMTDLTNQVRARQDELDGMTFDLINAQSELSSLKNEKSAMEEAVASLRAETSALRSGLAEMKEGRVVVFQGEMLAQVPLVAGDGGYDLDAAVETLSGVAAGYLNRKIEESWQIGEDESSRVVITDEMREAVENTLRASSGRKALRLTAPSNIVIGQAIEGIISVFDSSLIYKKGEILLTEMAYGWNSHEEAADVLYTMLKRINSSAVSKGVLPDPFTGTVGNLDTLDFYDIVDKMVAHGSGIVTILAADDIYTEGPVRLNIEVGDG